MARQQSVGKADTPGLADVALRAAWAGERACQDAVAAIVALLTRLFGRRVPPMR